MVCTGCPWPRRVKCEEVNGIVEAGVKRDEGFVLRSFLPVKILRMSYPAILPVIDGHDVCVEPWVQTVGMRVHELEGIFPFIIRFKVNGKSIACEFGLVVCNLHFIPRNARQ